MRKARAALVLAVSLTLSILEPARALAQARATPVRAPLVAGQAPAVVAPSPSLPALHAASPAVPVLTVAPALVAPFVSAAPAAPAAPAARATLAAAALSAASLARPETGAAAAKSDAGRPFDSSAAKRPSDSENAAVSGAEGRGAPSLAASAARGPAALKPIPPIPVARSAAASLRRAAPRLLMTAAAVGAAGLAHLLGFDAAALLPAALLAGSLGTPSSGADKAALLAGIRSITGAGRKIAYAEVGRVAARLGMSEGEVGFAFTELAAEGHFAIRDNRDAVYFPFKTLLDKGAEGGTRDALSLAVESVKMINSGASADHARAVALADQANALWPRPEFETLKANAALEFVTGLLSAHRRDLAARENRSPALDARLADAEEVLDWLSTATYELGSTPPMPERVHRKLVALVGSINPSQEDGPARDQVADGYIAALDFFERFDPKDYLYEGPVKGSSGSGAERTQKELDAFLAEIRGRTAPGETVTRETMVRAGKALGLASDAITASVAGLGDRGDLLIMGGGTVIYFDLREQARSDKDGRWDLHEEAVAAIKQLNQPGLPGYLRAVARLEALHQRYFESERREKGTSPAYEQLLALLADAKLEAARAVVEDHAGRAGELPDADRERLRQAQSWLATAHYALNRRQPLPGEVAKTLNAAASLSAFQAALANFSSLAERGEVARGVMAVRRFLSGLTPTDGDARFEASGAAEQPSATGWKPLDAEKYPTLAKFGVDLTKKAHDGLLPPLIGRSGEIRQIVKTLLRVEKNNPLVYGEKGVGKTAIVAGLAQKIVAGAIPELEGKIVVKLDLTALVAGTSLRGQFEERIKGVLEEVKKSEGRILLFIDEIHTIVGAGSAEGTQDAANILKEALADGSISVIGATTMDEARKIEKDGALARRFNFIQLPAPSKAEAELIVEGVKGRYEKKHKVTIGAEVVKAVVALASRYVTDRNLPDSALDLLDDASAEVELKAGEAAAKGEESPRREVLPEDLSAEIALRTGIPAGKLGADDKAQLRNLPGDLKRVVIGQEEAVTKVAEGVQRGRSDLRNPNQPIGSFLFLGPTGVGKTEIARQTAKTVFGSEKNMVRLDMSEYMEKHAVARMIGAPPGYVGYDQAGQLTEAVRRNPYTVILLDEIEKAHPEVLDVLLQVIDDGRLTDGQGRVVDFTNTIIMMTSNIGGSLAGQKAEEEENKPKRRIGFVTQDEEPEAPKAVEPAQRRGEYLKALKAKMRPELINRIGEDGIVVFNELGGDQMGEILDLRLKDLQGRLAEKKVTLALSAGAREEILKRAEARKEYGARPLKQIVDREVANAIVAADLEGAVGEGDDILVDWDAAKGRFTAVRR